MNKPAQLQPSVFVSYSHRDSTWLERLRVHLKPLMREGDLVLWADTAIRPGMPWKAEIAQALGRARVAVLLVSADFLASDFIASEELPPLLAHAKARGAVILPLILKPCRFPQTAGLSEFQTVNPPSESLIEMSEAQQEQTFVRLVDRIVEVLDALPEGDTGDGADDEAPAGENTVFHPGDRAGSRSAPQPCRFFVSPFFHQKKLWTLYGDVLVELLHDPSGESVFLIPSGAVSPHLRDTRHLRTPEGLSLVAKKQEAGEAFVNRWRNKELTGFRFVMTTKTGEARTKLYCPEYDQCLTGIIP